MAANYNIRPVMRKNECRRVLRRARNAEFDSVIVFLPRYLRQDRTYTSRLGLFQNFDLRMTFWGTGIDDFHVDEDMHENDHGSFVKSVHVSFDNEEYLEAYLYARVRKDSHYGEVRDVMDQLNRHLDLFKDDLRVGIAQEWCNQEPWRIIPRFSADVIKSMYDDAGHHLGWHYPKHDIAKVMQEHLPRGYGEEMPASDII